MIKIIFLLFLLAHQIAGDPFSENTFVVVSYVVTGTPSPRAIQIWEFDYNGTLLQTIPLPGYIQNGLLGTVTDENGLILSIPTYEGSPAASTAGMPCVTLAVNSNGTIVDKTKFSGVSGLYATAISGNNVWMSLSSELSYATRGATSRSVNDVISTLGLTVYFMQIVGDAMYMRADTGSLPYIYKSSPIPTSASVATRVDADTGGFPVTGFYFYNSTVVYAGWSTRLSKCTLGSTLHVDYFTTISGTVSSMIAKNIGGTPYIFVMDHYAGKITRWKDTGAGLVNMTDIITTIAPYQGRWMAESPQPSCSDSLLNRDETDVDCGGSKCSTCTNGKSCSVNGDCSSGYCNPNKKCSIPSCSDGWKNQDETDVDCGGSCDTKCVDTKACLVDGDCSSNYCNPDSICSTPICSDGFKNQNETDLDCGGVCGATCADLLSCLQDGDCTSAFCNPEAVCSTPSCVDGWKNHNETDIDCGGNCGPCEQSKSCLIDGDCLSKKCLNNVCGMSCFDDFKNQNETDIDCGGVCGATCDNNKSCLQDTDCVNAYCNPESVCSNPTCSDGWMNQDETDIDCGGSCSTKCANNKNCKVDVDCQSGSCNSVCVDPPVAPMQTPVQQVSTGNLLTACWCILLLSLV